MFAWQLALVGVSMLPVGVVAGYLRVHVLSVLDTQLRQAYEASATMACEQVAAIRTVASLNREIALCEEFRESLKVPMRKTLYTTLQSAAVPPYQIYLTVSCTQ